MYNYSIIENGEDYPNKTIVRFHDYEVDLDKYFFDIFEKNRPGEVDSIVNKTKDVELYNYLIGQVSEYNISIAKKRYPGVDFRIMDAGKLAFENDYFDEFMPWIF